MKNFNTIALAILALAVVGLYLLHFTGKGEKQVGVESSTFVADSAIVETHDEDEIAAAIGAGATSASPTHNAGTLTYKFSSGSTSTTKPADTYGTLSDTHTYTLAESKNGFTSVNSSNGTLTATSYGTTIGNARTSATVTCTRTCKWTPTSSYNAAGTITKNSAATATCTQNGNYVTKVEPKPSSGVAHVKYSNISAGATTSSPQTTGAATYTFSSGSTTTDSSSSPSFGGSASYSRTYAEKANSDASNAFSVNTTNGTVTTSHRGTTPGAARSVTVTATLVVKYTHATGMSAPNTSVSGTLVNDVVVTQNENKITSYGNWTTPTITVGTTSFPAAGGTATITISGDMTRTNTWSSGSKSTDTAYKSNKSASFATISSDYKTLTVGVNTTGSNRNGKVYIDWSFGSDNNVVKSVESNSYSQVGQSDCTLTLTGSTKVYHETATIIGKASVAGTIYWGTSQTSMTQSTSVSANTNTTITSRTSLGTTTIYAYFVPTDKNYKTLGSSSAYHTSASAKITQASDANITINTSNATYNGSAQTVVTCNPTDGVHGVSTWALGYATSSSATANSGVTWIADKTNLSLTNAGTYYIWRRWTADSNHSNSNGGEKIDPTVTIGKRTISITAPTKTDRTYSGSAQTIFAAGSCTAGGTMYYSDTNKTFSTSTWSTSLPYSQKTTAGTYTLYYYCYVSDISNNTGTGINTIKSISATIGKKATTAPTLTAGSKTTYDGSTVYAKAASASSNPAGKIYYGASSGATTYSITASTTAANLTSMGRTDVGTTTIYAFFRPTDTANYADSSVVSTTAKVVNKKATAAPTLTAGSKDTYDGGTVYAKAATGSGNPAGKIYYGASSGATTYNITASTTASNLSSMGRSSVGTTTIYAFFRPNDTTNYADSSVASTTVKVTNKATPTMTLAGSNKTYNGSASYITGTASVAGKIYYGTTSATSGMSTAVSVSANTATNLTSITNVGTLTVYAYFVPTDTTNYNSLGSSSNDHTSKSITISKRTVTITAPTKTDRTYSGSAQTIFTAGSCTTGGVMYYSDTNKTFSTSTWSTSVPTPKQTNAGTYTLYYYCYVSDTTNNTGTGINTIKSISATISKLGATLAYSPSDLSVQCKNSDTKLLTATTVSYTKASVGAGSASYTIDSVKNSSGTSVSYISLSSTNLSVAANTPVGDYTVTMTASQGNSNYTSTPVTKSFTVSVVADVLGSYVGTLSISPSTILSAGADSRTITWGAIHKVWASGREKVYATGTATLTQTCNDNTANTFVTINNTSYTNSSSTKESTLTKNSYSNYNHTVGATFTYTLKLGSTTIKTLTVYAQANTSTTTDTGITAYGTPTISIGDGMTAAGGSATVTCTVKNTMGTKTVFTSGYTTTGTKQVDGTATWSIASQSCVGGGTRFTKSGNTLAHTTMGANEGVDSISLTAVNSGDKTKTSGTGTGITNYRVHTLTGVTASYSNPASSSSGSTNTPTVKYSTSYKFLSGASGSTTSNNTAASISTGTSFTKSFSIVTNNTAASLNTSTGVVTWNSANTSTSTRQIVVKCTGTLTSLGSTSSKTSSNFGAVQAAGGSTPTYNMNVTVINNIQHSVTCNVMVNGSSIGTIDSSTTGQSISKVYSGASSVNVMIMPTSNASGASRTLSISLGGGGYNTNKTDFNPDSKSVSLPSNFTTNGTMVSVYVERQATTSATVVVTVTTS